jgi:hypothetical protein
MAVQTRIQVRRGTLSQWNTAAAVAGQGILYQGEIGYETDTGRFKIGDGTTAWGSLSYASVLPSNFVAGSGISLTPGLNGSTMTISLSDPTIQVGDITDFAEGVDDRVASLLQAGNNISLTYNDTAGTLTINSSLGLEEVQDAIGAHIVGGSGISVNYNDTSGNTTISLSDPTIQAADVTDFSEAVDDRVSNLLTAGSGIGLTYDDNANSLQVRVTGIPSSLITNFTSSVNDLIDGAVSTSIVAGSGVDIIYNSGNNTLSISSALTAGSGIALTHSSGAYVVSLSDPSIQLVDITDMTTAVRNFLTTPSSANLGSLVSDETGTGSLVFANNPTMSGVTVNGNLTVSGSGLVASNINNFDSQVRTSRLDQMAVPTTSVSLNSQRITSLADPVADQDAATKAYVDAARSGLDVKQSVRVATTVALTQEGELSSVFANSGGAGNGSGSGSGFFIIDGVSLNVGDRVLVKNQSDATKNGIYNVTPSPTYSGQQILSRAPDANSDAEVTAGMFVFVTEGTVNADSGWVLTTNDTITLGTTALTFAQFSGAGQITAGAGMVKSGNTLDVGTASTSRIVVNADNIDLATVTQSDGSGSAGSTFVQSVTRDSYGRVTGVTTAAVQDATTSVKGIASFDTGDFSVSGGAVSIKTGGVDNSQLANSSVTVGSTSISLGGSATTIAGLTSVSSTSFTGALTGNASTATTLQTARTINGTSFNGSANIEIAFVDGGTP